MVDAETISRPRKRTRFGDRLDVAEVVPRQHAAPQPSDACTHASEGFEAEQRTGSRPSVGGSPTPGRNAKPFLLGPFSLKPSMGRRTADGVETAGADTAS